jgi:hypothetical protein
VSLDETVNSVLSSRSLLHRVLEEVSVVCVKTEVILSYVYLILLFFLNFDFQQACFTNQRSVFNQWDPSNLFFATNLSRRFVRPTAGGASAVGEIFGALPDTVRSVKFAAHNRRPFRYNADVHAERCLYFSSVSNEQLLTHFYTYIYFAGAVGAVVWCAVISSCIPVLSFAMPTVCACPLPTACLICPDPAEDRKYKRIVRDRLHYSDGLAPCRQYTFPPAFSPRSTLA